MKRVFDFYSKDECGKYYKLGKRLGQYVLAALVACCCM